LLGYLSAAGQVLAQPTGIAYKSETARQTNSLGHERRNTGL
jgi:hypothetical protein